MNSKMTLSKRLFAILPTNNCMEIKLNSNIFQLKFRLESYFVSHTDITLENVVVDEYNYYCFNKSNKITCWPMKKGNQPLNESGQWKLEGRTEMKPGKFLLLLKNYARVFDEDGDRIDDEKIIEKVFARSCEIFTDIIRGYNAPLSFETSENIADVYEMNSHDNSGYLLNSCMRPDSGYGCNAYSYFYNCIPDLKIICKEINDSLLFRALLWKAEDEKGHPVTFLDRIYGSDAINNQLIDYAKDHGWAWRSFSNNYIYLQDKKINLQCKIPQSAFDYLEEDGSPYMDSLYNLSFKNKEWWLSNYMPGEYIIQSCEGDAIPKKCCNHCGERLNDDDTLYYNDHPYCERCYNDLFSYCEKCDETYYNEDILFKIIDGEEMNICSNCLEDYHLCVECGQYVSEISDSGHCLACDEKKLLAWEETQDGSMLRKEYERRTNYAVGDIEYDVFNIVMEYKREVNLQKRNFEHIAIENVNEQILQLNECQ